MDHALEAIPRLLAPGGILLDLHPAAAAWRIEVHLGGRVLFAEPFRGLDYCDEDVLHTEAALEQVIQRGLYVVESRREFDFLAYGPSVGELQEFLSRENAYDDRPGDAQTTAREAELAAQVEAVMQAAGPGAEVAFHERGRIARLRPRVPAD